LSHTNGSAPRPLQAVIFDCDGLLLETESRWTMAEKAVVERWGSTWRPELKTDLLGLAVPEAAERLTGMIGVPLADAGAIAGELNHGFADALVEHGCEPCDGVAALVTSLADEGVAIAVASNSARHLVLAAIEHSGLPDRFSAVVCADERTPAKPEPDVYLAACTALGVDPSRAVALEDSQTGITAARAAGIRVIGVPSIPGAPLEADLVVPTLAGITPADIERLLAPEPSRPV
jgi:HAD superfamily hydrolase (TIGR01509 family)